MSQKKTDASYCKYVIAGSRYLLGLMALIFGLNKFIGFMKSPEMNVEMAAFMKGLMTAGYIFPTIGIVLIASGIMLIIGRIVPFALILLFPISLNIFLTYWMFDPAGIGMGMVLLAMNAFLIYTKKRAYMPMLAGDCYEK